ncbi:MAG: hypothetical protein PHQ81_02790 [Methanofollis sp.]|nr:hypothetical protein [Methanofollis sp.]
MEIAFRGLSFFVRDMERAKEFYIDVLGQEVSLDLGVNVEFVGGLALWERGYVNDLLFEGKMPGDEGVPRMEVYFETNAVKEVAEPMDAVVLRLADKGLSADEIAERTMLPMPVIEAFLRGECCD